jgi:DNA mismatch endonuclease, patch repair protein
MSRIRGRDTSPELCLRNLLHRAGLRYRTHSVALPGRPDVVFVSARVAVFVHGDFWHGWHFSQWRAKLGAYWQAKIERNRARDRRNVRSLRQAGWVVLTIWEHQLERNPATCAERVAEAVQRRAAPPCPR